MKGKKNITDFISQAISGGLAFDIYGVEGTLPKNQAKTKESLDTNFSLSKIQKQLNAIEKQNSNSINSELTQLISIINTTINKKDSLANKTQETLGYYITPLINSIDNLIKKAAEKKAIELSNFKFSLESELALQKQLIKQGISLELSNKLSNSFSNLLLSNDEKILDNYGKIINNIPANQLAALDVIDNFVAEQRNSLSINGLLNNIIEVTTNTDIIHNQKRQDILHNAIENSITSEITADKIKATANMKHAKVNEPLKDKAINQEIKAITGYIKEFTQEVNLILDRSLESGKFDAESYKKAFLKADQLYPGLFLAHQESMLNRIVNNLESIQYNGPKNKLNYLEKLKILLEKNAELDNQVNVNNDKTQKSILEEVHSEIEIISFDNEVLQLLQDSWNKNFPYLKENGDEISRLLLDIQKATLSSNEEGLKLKYELYNKAILQAAEALNLADLTLFSRKFNNFRLEAELGLSYITNEDNKKEILRKELGEQNSQLNNSILINKIEGQLLASNGWLKEIAIPVSENEEALASKKLAESIASLHKELDKVSLSRLGEVREKIEIINEKLSNLASDGISPIENEIYSKLRNLVILDKDKPSYSLYDVLARINQQDLNEEQEIENVNAFINTLEQIESIYNNLENIELTNKILSSNKNKLPKVEKSQFDSVTNLFKSWSNNFSSNLDSLIDNQTDLSYGMMQAKDDYKSLLTRIGRSNADSLSHNNSLLDVFENSLKDISKSYSLDFDIINLETRVAAESQVLSNKLKDIVKQYYDIDNTELTWKFGIKFNNKALDELLFRNASHLNRVARIDNPIINQIELDRYKLFSEELIEILTINLPKEKVIECTASLFNTLEAAIPLKLEDYREVVKYHNNQLGLQVLASAEKEFEDFIKASNKIDEFSIAKGTEKEINLASLYTNIVSNIKMLDITEARLKITEDEQKKEVLEEVHKEITDSINQSVVRFYKQFELTGSHYQLFNENIKEMIANKLPNNQIGEELSKSLNTINEEFHHKFYSNDKNQLGKAYYSLLQNVDSSKFNKKELLEHYYNLKEIKDDIGVVNARNNITEKLPGINESEVRELLTSKLALDSIKRNEKAIEQNLSSISNENLLEELEKLASSDKESKYFIENRNIIDGIKNADEQSLKSARKFLLEMKSSELHLEKNAIFKKTRAQVAILSKKDLMKGISDNFEYHHQIGNFTNENNLISNGVSKETVAALEEIHLSHEIIVEYKNEIISMTNNLEEAITKIEMGKENKFGPNSKIYQLVMEKGDKLMELLALNNKDNAKKDSSMENINIESLIDKAPIQLLYKMAKIEKEAEEKIDKQSLKKENVIDLICNFFKRLYLEITLNSTIREAFQEVKDDIVIKNKNVDTLEKDNNRNKDNFDNKINSFIKRFTDKKIVDYNISK